MKSGKRVSLIAASVLLCMLASLFFGTVSAGTESAGPVDPDRECSLTLTYRTEKQNLPGLQIEIYRAAALSESMRFIPLGLFDTYHINFNGVSSQQEWKALSDTVGSYVIADGIKPDASAVTDENGVVSFSGLKTGLYYIRMADGPLPTEVSGFDPFLLSLPSTDAEGKWTYDLNAFPKPGGNLTSPPEKAMRIIKQWKDYSDKNRPASVEVEIYCDGKEYKKVTLTKENDWTHVFTVEDDHEWVVVERRIPDRYTVTVERSGMTYIITNTTSDAPPPPPQTGDGNAYLFLLLPLLAAGAGMILIPGRRKRDE